MANKNDPKINLSSLSAKELYDLLYNEFKVNYDTVTSPDHPRYPGGYKVNGLVMDENRYQKMAKEQFDEKVKVISSFKGNKEALYSILAPVKDARKHRFLPGYTTDYLLGIGNKGGTETTDPIPATVVSEDEDEVIEPGITTSAKLLGERVMANVNATKQKNEYLTGLFDKYTDVNTRQAIASSTANILNLGVNIRTRKKALDELTLPEFNIPGKDVVRLHAPNVKTSFDRLSGQIVNTGIQQARELGRPELIPSILYQGQQVAEKGILEQGRIDTETSNKQAMIDLQLSEAFRGREMQAEGIKFQSEVQIRNARAGVYDAFGNNLKQTFAAQADILNKTLINPIAVQVDWLDKYGYTGLFDKSIKE